jgi:hypothetical protein
MRLPIHFAMTAAVLLTVGCAITQAVKPIPQLDEPEICIIQAPAVRPGFLDTYRRTLAAKGYRVRQLPPESTVKDCPVVSTYMGLWSWDLALYVSFAEIVVYKSGEEIGRATYDARQGGANMGKFVKGEEKIGELVNALFPGLQTR